MTVLFRTKWLWISLFLFSCESDEKKITTRPAPHVHTTQKEILRDGQNAIQIRLGATDEILLNGRRIDISDLRPSLSAAKREMGDTATVVIHLTSATKIGVFTDVHETLEALLKEERDSVALVRFDHVYDNLSPTQKSVIKRKHHLRIIEKMKR